MLNKGKRFSIKVSLILIMVVHIVLPVILVIFLLYLGGQRSVNDLSNNLLKKIGSLVEEKAKTYIYSAYESSFIISNAINDSVVDLDNTDSLFNLFKSVMLTNKSIPMIYYADDSGNLYMLRRMADGSFSKRFVKNDGKYIHIDYEHQNPFYKKDFLNELHSAEFGYDPRKRSWYKTAKKAKKFSWSSPYIFATDKKPGITGATPIYNSDKTLRGVLSVDIEMAGISYFLNGIEITQNSFVFIHDSDKNMIAMPIRDKEGLSGLYRKIQEDDKISYKINTLDDMKNSIYKDTYTKHIKSGQKHFSYDSEDKDNLIVTYLNIKDDVYPDWKIGVIIPEDDIMATVNANTQKAFVLIAMVVILSLILGLIFSNKIIVPLEILEQEMAKIKYFEIDHIEQIDSSFSEISNMNNTLQSVKNGLLSFRKYVPYELVSGLIKNGKIAISDAKREEITMLFSDIESFTTISENSDTFQLVKSLEKYFNKATKPIIKNKGVIDKYIGDAIFAFWGAPNKVDNHPFLACISAIEMQRDIDSLNKIFIKQGKEPFSTRIGINTAEVVVGNIGNDTRMNYTAIGDGVNLAARLEGLNKHYNTKILISDSTYVECKEHILARLIDTVVVKGKKNSVKIYNLLGIKSEMSEELVSWITRYNEAMEFYCSADYAKALEVFEELDKSKMSDSFLKDMIRKCKSPSDSNERVFDTK